jgi:hypothetical protein
MQITLFHHGGKQDPEGPNPDTPSDREPTPPAPPIRIAGSSNS